MPTRAPSRTRDHISRRRWSGGSVAFGIAAVIAVALNIGDQIPTVVQYPDVPPLFIGFDSGIGLIYAAAAVLIRRWGLSPRISWLLLAGSAGWTAGTFRSGLQEFSPWWVALFAVQGTLSVVIFILAVSYPNGRLSRFGRAAVAIFVAFFVVDIVAHVFLYDPGTPVVANPLAGLSTPELSDLTYRYSYAWGALYDLSLALIVVIRWTRGSGPWRAVNLLMVIAVLVLSATELPINVSQTLGLPSGQFLVPNTLQQVAAGAIPIIYVVGLYGLGQARSRVADVILAARNGIDRQEWDRLIREALDDRGAHVLWRDASTDGFVDASGAAAALPDGAAVVRSNDVVIAALVHDPATAAKSDLLASLAESLRLMTENDRLTADLERSLAQVRESRQRLVGAGDEARRRIERDLHDGAQQLLLTAALSVENASRRAGSGDDPELVRLLTTATDQLLLARRELRELARGITPAVLDHGGLDAALEELALRSPVPTTVRVTGAGAPSELAQTTVYFTVAEALTNIAKHAGATTASVDVELGDPLHLTISDDGMGGAAAAPNGGLAGLLDRIEAVGGRFTVSSPVGRGTVIEATVPSRDREPA